MALSRGVRVRGAQTNTHDGPSSGPPTYHDDMCAAGPLGVVLRHQKLRLHAIDHIVYMHYMCVTTRTRHQKEHLDGQVRPI